MIQEARELLFEYLEEGLKMTPSFKGYGFKYIQFAMDYPKYFQTLFLEKSTWHDYETFLRDEMMGDKTIPSIMTTFHINEAEARWLLGNLYLYTHGIACLVAARGKCFSEEEISEGIGHTCRAYMIALKTGADERTGVIPMSGVKMPGSISDYVKLDKALVRKTIAGYGGDKTIHKIYLDDLLYVEAVGEMVFAYTEEEVYEIKKRLYQVEAEVLQEGFLRASKSVLVNTREIASFQPGMNRCMYAVMSNGEQVLITRKYAKEVLDAVKQIWGE